LKGLLQNSVKRETEGVVSVALPSSTSFEVRTVPDLKIFVNSEAYHKGALGFRIAIDDDLRSGRIASVSYSVIETARVEEPKVIVTEETPVVVAPPPVVPRERGLSYKVQILSLYKPIPLSDLPQRFRMNDVTIEKYNVGGVTYYKYVVPGGTLDQAISKRRQMRDAGIEDAWIPIYEDGVRIAPSEGLPEIVR
jgi:hypothetical protein